MNGTQIKSKPASNKGVFLFFVVGLFMLQIVFAFTIHGDIGPQTAIVPEIQQSATPLLMGKIDSIVSSSAAQSPKPSRPTPVAAMAPACKKVIDALSGPASNAHSSTKKASALQDGGGHYMQYVINRGDTLDSISKKLYGSKKMVTALVRLNRLKNEKTLRCGDNLRVPRQGLKK